LRTNFISALGGQLNFYAKNPYLQILIFGFGSWPTFQLRPRCHAAARHPGRGAEAYCAAILGLYFWQ
jgi:hypothetical protein